MKIAFGLFWKLSEGKKKKKQKLYTQFYLPNKTNRYYRSCGMKYYEGFEVYPSNYLVRLKQNLARKRYT